MKKMKKVIAGVCSTILLVSALGAVPALAASNTVSGIAMNRIYNTSALGGTWHNQGKSNSAYSNFYHASSNHYSIVGSSYSAVTATSSARAGSWSYATLNLAFPAGTTFNFTCGTN